MGKRRLSVRKIKEILRLSGELGLSRREIARSLTVSHNTVSDVLGRATAAQVSWPTAEALSEEELDRRLYPPTIATHPRPEPDPEHLHRELKRKGVTLQLLWLEYKAEYPDGLGYTQFCQRYRRWRDKLDVTFRQNHRAGEKLFVDFAGQKMAIVERTSGLVSQCPIFVATLGASSYTYAEACRGEDVRSFLLAHVRALEFFGGSPRVVVCDNTKAAVTGPSFYEPDLNPAYADLARHYGLVILPARVRRPRDKAKVESAVLAVERRVLAPLRDRRFFSLAELNQAIRAEVERLNSRPFTKMAGSRRSLFETLERPALLPLPRDPYELATWKRARVNIDYHVEVGGAFYSVPYSLAREEVEVRVTETTVEILKGGERVASHARTHERGRYVTTSEHMPESHRRYLEWSPSRLVAWGAGVGPETARLIETILEHRRHPEHGYRACLGIMRLSRRYPRERMEAAAGRALALQALSYRSLKSILERGLDQVEAAPEPARLPLQHENLRGPAYFSSGKETKC